MKVVIGVFEHGLGVAQFLRDVTSKQFQITNIKTRHCWVEISRYSAVKNEQLVFDGEVEFDIPEEQAGIMLANVFETTGVEFYFPELGYGGIIPNSLE